MERPSPRPAARSREAGSSYVVVLIVIAMLLPTPRIVSAGMMAGAGIGDVTLDSMRRFDATPVVLTMPMIVLGSVNEIRVGPVTRSRLPTPAIVIALKQYSPGASSMSANASTSTPVARL